MHVYDLSAAETDELTREFLSTRCTEGTERFVCYEIEGTDRFANIPRQLEREVFEDSWGNDAATMSQEFGPYDESSLFFVAIDTHESAPAGMVRMIRNSPAGLKTLVDLDDRDKSPIAPITIPVEDVLRFHGIDDLDRCWDGASAAIPARYRRRMATMHVQIMAAWSIAAMRENIEHFIAVLDAPVFKAARDLLGLPLVPLADTPPFTHMDAPNNQAVYAHLLSTLAVAAQGNRKVGDKLRDCFSAARVPVRNR